MKQSAEEVAEEIVRKYLGGIIPDPEKGCAGLCSLIAQALTAFAEERVKETRGKCYSKAAQEDLKHARAEALEEAAKIAEYCDHAHSCEGPMIAKAIRALKGKP